MLALASHIPHAVAQSLDAGKMDVTQELPITVSLNLNHQDELEQELAAIYQPGSPKYHHFLTPEAFRAHYASTAEQGAQVKAFLETQGLHSVQVDPNGLLVHARGSVANLNAAFHTELHHYTDASGKAYHAPHYELQIPAELPIQGVHGLQSLTYAHTHLKGPVFSSNAAHAGTGPNGGYSPADIRSAYNIPAALDGSGQTLALFELDGYTASDITAYETQFGLPATPLQNILIDGASGSPGSGQGEVSLDIELMIAVAPKVSQILVYEGANSDQGMLDTYNRIASDNIAKSVSTSWGTSEDGATTAMMQSENNIFMQMAAQGQTIYSAAGDAGAYDNGSTLSVDDPSAQPYVVAVGGTTLTTSASGYVSETTWNDSSGAGGGGVSKVWTIPNWQAGVVSASTLGSTTMRNVPDVALHSDINSGYSIYNAGSWGNWGGTSCSAPLWAAFTALVNQQRAAHGLPSLGYANPAIYSIGQSKHYGADFHDIADASTNKYYPALTGYDDATGWGSFNGANLLSDLAQEPQGGASSSLVGGSRAVCQ